MENNSLQLLTNAQAIINRAKTNIKKVKPDCPCSNKLKIANMLIEQSKTNVKNYKKKQSIKKQENNNYNEMSKLKEIGIIIGSQMVGKVITVLADQIDLTTGNLTEPLWKKPSVYINLIGWLSKILFSMLSLKKYPDWQIAGAIVGSHMLTKTIDYAKQNIITMMETLPPIQ